MVEDKLAIVQREKTHFEIQDADPTHAAMPAGIEFRKGKHQICIFFCAQNIELLKNLE
jgi:hypothetical protein